MSKYGAIRKYTCPTACGQVTFEQFSWSDNKVTCPTCGKEAKVVPPDRNAEAQEYESVALGIHPTQIAEAREKFPHHRFLSNGNMLIKGQREKDRVLKDLGYVEYDNKNQMKQPDKGKY